MKRFLVFFSRIGFSRLLTLPSFSFAPTPAAFLTLQVAEGLAKNSYNSLRGIKDWRTGEPRRPAARPPLLRRTVKREGLPLGLERPDLK